MKTIIITAAVVVAIVAAAAVWVTLRPAPAGYSVIENKPKETVLVSKEDLIASPRYFDLRDKDKVLVSMADYFFQPQKIVIKNGTIVIWKNEDNAEHIIKSDYPPLNSPPIRHGETAELKFTQPGTYYYFCANHPDKMAGLIIVK